jgi:FkbM family methyltransferase
MGLLANYVVLPLAVAEQNGSAAFHVNRYDGASSLLPFVPEGLARWIRGGELAVTETVTVPTMRLDTFLDGAGIGRVHYLKIDAQGTDLAVIRSAGERLRDIDRISLEVQTTPFELYRGASRKEDVLEFLAAAGFELVEVEAQSFDQEENLTFVRRETAPLRSRL